MEYIELLSQSSQHWLYFSPTPAKEKAKEIRKAGNKAVVLKDSRYWTVFLIK